MTQLDTSAVFKIPNHKLCPRILKRRWNVTFMQDITIRKWFRKCLAPRAFKRIYGLKILDAPFCCRFFLALLPTFEFKTSSFQTKLSIESSFFLRLKCNIFLYIIICVLLIGFLYSLKSLLHACNPYWSLKNPDGYVFNKIYVCMYEILLLFLFYSPNIVKNNIVHLVFVAIHEQDISASSAESFRGDSQLYLLIKLLNILFAT